MDLLRELLSENYFDDVNYENLSGDKKEEQTNIYHTYGDGLANQKFFDTVAPWQMDTPFDRISVKTDDMKPYEFYWEYMAIDVEVNVKLQHRETRETPAEYGGTETKVHPIVSGTAHYFGEESHHQWKLDGELSFDEVGGSQNFEIEVDDTDYKSALQAFLSDIEDYILDNSQDVISDY